MRIVLRDKKIENEQIILEKTSGKHQLGHNLILKNCDLILKVVHGRCFIGSTTKFWGGSITAKVRMTQWQADLTELKDVTFYGKYRGCDFGSVQAENRISNCDFTSAELDRCRFLNCDMDTIILPKWPHFSILRSRTDYTRINEIHWPSEYKIIMNRIATSHPAFVAETFFVPQFIKQYGGSEEDLRKGLEELGGVVM